MLQKGALAVLCEERGAAGEPRIVVPDTLAAMQQIAAASRKRWDIPFIGVTGSVGKTTAKEMLAAALSGKYEVFKTPGSMNGQIGIPVSLIGLHGEYDVAVIEMGVSLFGEMTRLTNMVHPDMAVFTNIGDAHLEALGDRPGILRAKSEILHGMGPDAVIFANGDDALLSAADFGRKTVLFGLGENCDWRAVELEADTEGTKFICVHDGKRVEMYVPAAGEHNVRNALAAVAVAVEVGVPKEKAVAAIRTYAPPAMRQQIKEAHGITLVDDTYNASPDSMRAALKILGGLKATGKKYAVLADMLELGDYAERGHYETGAFAAENGTDVLIGVGPLAKHIVEGFKNRENSAWFASNAEAIAYLKDRLHPGDAVLCKGSRGMHMDEIIHALSE